MRKFQSIARVAAFAAGLSLLASPALQAGEIPVASRTVGSDVVLTNGTLQGQYITSAGVPVDGAQVVIRQGQHEVARTVTNAKGEFTVSDLKTGAYEIQTPTSVELVRAWDSSVAPASSSKAATIVSQNAVRSQGWAGNTTLTWIALGFGIVGTTLGVIAITDDDCCSSNSP